MVSQDDASHTFYAGLLEDAGYAVTRASSWDEPEGVPNRDVKLVLLDINSRSLCELGIYQRLTASPGGERIPVVVLIMPNTEYDWVALSRARIDRVLYKPWDTEKLPAVISTLLPLCA
ncbi:MAG TPA: hypothetical protein VGM23_12590 [Armatimonadota bacterium]